MIDLELLPECICYDPKNCTTPIPGYRCRYKAEMGLEVVPPQQTGEREELVKRLRDQRRGCPTCDGVDPKSCVRCQGQRPMWSWYVEEAAAFIASSGRDEMVMGMRVVVNPSVPPDELWIRDAVTGRQLGTIVNLDAARSQGEATEPPAVPKP